MRRERERESDCTLHTPVFHTESQFSGLLGGYLGWGVGNPRATPPPPNETLCVLLDRKYYESLSLEEKRKLYTCGRDFLTLDEIETWEEFRKKLSE